MDKSNQRIIAIKEALKRLLDKKQNKSVVIISDPGDEQVFYNITKKTNYEK